MVDARRKTAKNSEAHGCERRPLTVALVGAGKVAKKHLKAIRYHAKLGNLQLVGVVDPQRERADALLAEARGAISARVFSSLDDLLAETVPDIVSLTTPSGLHYVQARQALNAGAHVFVEKPLTLDLDEADELLALAEAKQRQIVVGHIYRYFPLIKDVAAALASGAYGRILFGTVKLYWGHDQKYYDQAAWRGTWAQDGGAVMNQSVHALDLMCYLLNSMPVEISGRIARVRHRMEAEDLGFAHLRMDNGSYLELLGTTATHPEHKEAEFFVQAERGSFRASIKNGSIKFSIKDENLKSHAGRYIRKYLKETWREGRLAALKQAGNPHTGIYTDLIAAICEGKMPLATGQTGRDAVAMVLCIYQSAREGHNISCPPTDRRIVPVEL